LLQELVGEVRLKTRKIQKELEETQQDLLEKVKANDVLVTAVSKGTGKLISLREGGLRWKTKYFFGESGRRKRKDKTNKEGFGRDSARLVANEGHDDRGLFEAFKTARAARTLFAREAVFFYARSSSQFGTRCRGGRRRAPKDLLLIMGWLRNFPNTGRECPWSLRRANPLESRKWWTIGAFMRCDSFELTARGHRIPGPFRPPDGEPGW
jgi:hypothetical protein